MSNKDIKNEIIQRAAHIIYEKGFNNTGLKEILDVANVPKGSFYYYFKNKEDLGVEIIKFHRTILVDILEKHLHSEKYSHIERLKCFFDAFNEKMKNNQMRGGCPLGNLGQELSDLNDPIRGKINEVFLEMAKKIEECLIRAQENEEISNLLDVEKIAHFILNSWQGALMRTKISKDMKHLEIFDEAIFEMLFHKN